MINVSWTDLKAFATQRGSSIQWVIANNSYYLWVFDGPMFMTAQIVMDGSQADDQTDFETNYQSSGNQPPKGNVVQVLGKDSLTLAPFGYFFTATANQSTDNDVALPSNMVLRGGVLFSPNAVMGDYVTITIIDKDNVTGFGATPEAPITLGQYIMKWYVIPNQQNKVEDVSISQELMQGLYVRITYHSVSPSTNADVIINFISYV